MILENISNVCQEELTNIVTNTLISIGLIELSTTCWLDVYYALSWSDDDNNYYKQYGKCFKTEQDRDKFTNWLKTAINRFDVLMGTEPTF